MSAAVATSKSKSEMTQQELLALEEAEFQTGPLSLLTQVKWKKVFLPFLVGQEPQPDLDYVQVKLRFYFLDLELGFVGFRTGLSWISSPVAFDTGFFATGRARYRTSCLTYWTLDYLIFYFILKNMIDW